MRTNTRNRLVLLLACVVAVATSSCVLFNGGGDDDGPVKVVDAGSNCTNPDFPVDCGEGDCWSPTTDCSFPRYDCGGSAYRCRTATDWAACCSDQFVSCPAGFPYYCPGDMQCYTESGACDGSSCTFRAAACSASAAR